VCANGCVFDWRTPVGVWACLCVGAISYISCRCVLNYMNFSRVCLCVSLCMCVCLCERENEFECVCVCVCVYISCA